MNKTFLLYDGRAVESTEDALVMDTAGTEDEARRIGSKDWDGYDFIWWEYEANGRTIRNGEPRYDLPPCNNFEATS
jgi:hypothetical protein